MDKQINPDRFADSAGRPWQGRSFEPNAFSDDDGSAPVELMNAISNLQNQSGTIEKVIDELRSARVLVPLLASLGEAGDGAHGKKVDKSADLSIVTVSAPDGQDALVIFSSVDSMQRWNSSARPVPTDAVRVTLAAAAQGATRVVLDPGSETEFVIRRPAIAKIAQSQSWLAPWKDPIVKQVVGDSIRAEEIVVGFDLATDDPHSKLVGSELVVKLGLRIGLEEEVISSALGRISDRWAESSEFVERVDSVRISLLAS